MNRKHCAAVFALLVVGATGLLGAPSPARADQAAGNDAYVEGSVQPDRLGARTYSPVSLFTGIRNQLVTGVPVAGVSGRTGAPAAPVPDRIDFGRNVKIDLGVLPRCTKVLDGTTTAQALAACPIATRVGQGVAAILIGGAVEIGDFTVTAFNGPRAGQMRLHAYSPTLGSANTLVILANVVKTDGRYASSLVIDTAAAAAGGAVITNFNLTIPKATGVVRARCEDAAFLWRRTVTYEDRSQDVALLSRPCFRK